MSESSTLCLPTESSQLENPLKSSEKGSRRPRLSDKQQALAEKYVPLARKLAKPLKLSWPGESEEFESAAMVALVEAAQSFDENRNVKFATYARHRIRGALRDVQRSLVVPGWRDDMENAPLLASLMADAEEYGRVVNATPDPPVGEEMEMVDYMEAWLRKLPAKHAQACRHLYLHGKTQGEAAEAMGCSKSRLSYLHKESLEIIGDAWRYERQRLARKGILM